MLIPLETLPRTLPELVSAIGAPASLAIAPQLQQSPMAADPMMNVRRPNLELPVLGTCSALVFIITLQVFIGSQIAGLQRSAALQLKQQQVLFAKIQY